MKSGGLTSAFGGNLAVMDVYAAQKVFGRGRKFDRIDLARERRRERRRSAERSSKRCWARAFKCKSRRRARSSSIPSRASTR